jgi:uncharacterized protein (TIGR02217 family)
MSSLSIFSQKNSPFGSYKSEPLLSVTVEWLTQILEAPRKGKENRTAKLTEPRFSLEGSDFILTDESYDTLSQAFIDNDGQGSGFFFKCPLDYYVTATPEVYDTGVYQQGILHNLSGNTYQICKRYSVAGINTYKTILGVIGSTLQVYKDNALVTTGYTLNAELGTVTFGSAQTGVLTVSCEYELKFRFDVSDLQLKQIKRAIAEYGGDRNVYQSINFRLVEYDYSKVSPLETSDWASLISYDFGDYKLPNTTYSERVLSRIEKGDNLKESREILTPVRRQFKYEQCNRNWKDLQRVYTLFNVAKGQLLPFGFEGINVRFDADSFGCEQLGRNAWSINEMGSIETLFSVGEEVKNWAYFVKVGIECSPKSLIFADSLSSFSGWSTVSQETAGIYSGAIYNLDTSGGFWRVTMQYDPPGPARSAYIEWSNGWSYTPVFANEVISFTFSGDVRLVSNTVANGNYPLALVAKQNSTIVLIDLDPGDNTDWQSKSASALFPSFVVGVPITLNIARRNSNQEIIDTFTTTITDAKNIVVDVNVTCS